MSFPQSLFMLVIVLLAPVISCPSPSCGGCDSGNATCTFITTQQYIPVFNNITSIQSLNMVCLGTSSLLSLDNMQTIWPVQYLAIKGCGPTVIKDQSFLGLDILIHLNVSQNNIFFIQKNALIGLESLQLLDLSHNHLTILEDFPDLPQLRGLYINHNFISTIEEGTFNALKSLRTLSLTNNSIHTLDGHVFEHLPLRTLHLSRNQLTGINSGVFPETVDMLDLSYNGYRTFEHDLLLMPNIKQLTLHHNSIDDLVMPEMSIMLELLDLSFNKLQTIHHNFTETIKMSTIHRLFLYGNPLHCNCLMEPFRKVFLSSEQNFTDGRVHTYPSCQTPYPVFVTNAIEPFRCTKPSVTINVDANHMECRAEGDPCPQVNWYNSEMVLAQASDPPSDHADTSNSVKIPLPDHPAQGIHMCQASNIAGLVNESIFIIVKKEEQLVQNENIVSLEILIGAIVGTFALTLLFVLVIFLCSKCARCCRDRSGSKSKISSWDESVKKKQKGLTSADPNVDPPHFDNRRKHVEPVSDGDYMEIPANKRKSKSQSRQHKSPSNNQLLSMQTDSDVDQQPLAPENTQPPDDSQEPVRVQYMNLQPPMMHFTTDPEPLSQHQSPRSPQSHIYFNQPPVAPSTLDPGARRSNRQSRPGHDRIRFSASAQGLPRTSVDDAWFNKSNPNLHYQGVNFQRTRSFGGYGGELDC